MKSPVVLWLIALCLPVLSAQERAGSAAGDLRIGNLRLHPSGFLETLGLYRSATTADSVSTRFGRIPTGETDGQWLNSFRHSRVMLKGDLSVGPVKLSAYMESDFMNFTPGQSPYRWRQYWGQAQIGSWEILGGQAWSLLRPNRAGISTDKDMMNTDVIEPNYHVGLAGFRRRQVRVARTFENYKVAVAWEAAGNFAAKIARDSDRTHFELAAMTGRFGRRGVSAAATVRLTPTLRLVTQQFWGKRNIDEALGDAPAGRSGVSTLAGVEYELRKSLNVFSYAGMVYASRSEDNRMVSQFTLGLSREVDAPLGSVIFSAQFSHTGRALWNGAAGQMNYVMARVRYNFP